MASMRKSAHANLESMVRGAGKAVRKAPKKSSVKSGRFISTQMYKQLSALISANGKTIQSVPLAMIDVGENIRSQYDDDKLKVLAQSLEKDGLIQFPTLCMKKQSGGHRFLCRNGHRRVLAAKLNGWKSIECMIIPFSSAKDELYHLINANLKEDVFYLDLAHAYQDAADMGESDKDIADRVGMNPRTIGWYRRLCKMSPTCQKLCREHAHLFTATWAIKLARQGELPAGRALESMMRKMIQEGQSWLRSRDGEGKGPELVSPAKKRQALQKVRAMFVGRRGGQQASFARDLLEQLRVAGCISNSSVSKIEKDFFKENTSDLVRKSLKSRTARAKRA